jgi:hypothetical protein
MNLEKIVIYFLILCAVDGAQLQIYDKCAEDISKYCSAYSDPTFIVICLKMHRQGIIYVSFV